MIPLNANIIKIVDETPSTRTFFFDHSFENAITGQFVMVWIRGVDEIPMTLSYKNAITVQKVGDATSRLFSMEEGESVGLRGPFGKGFTVPRKGERTLLIAGGVGAAPLAPLAEKAVSTGSQVTTILGARNGNELLFINRFLLCGQIYITTDDGSAHRCGFVTDVLDELDVSEYERIYTCGPEMMMKRVFDILGREDVLERTEFSLHRYFKCGIGICGACCMDDTGLRVCKDGPVFNGKELGGTEFGKYAREPSGQKKLF